MQLRPLGPLSDNCFWQFGGAVYDLFPFVVSVCASFPFVASGLCGLQVKSLAVLIERDHPKKLGVTRGSRLAVQSAYGADGAIHQEALVVGMRAQI
jgi:hypothetical protein